MLKFLLKTIQNRLCCIRVHGQRHGKRVCLLLLARRVAGMQLADNGSVSWKRRSNLPLATSSCLWKIYSITFAKSPLLYVLLGQRGNGWCGGRDRKRRVCQNRHTLSFFAQSPDFLKPGLCYVPKFL